LDYLVLCIVEQNRYVDYHEYVVKILRQHISTTMPIVVIPAPLADTKVVSSKSEDIHVFSRFDTRLIEMVNQLVSSYRPASNHFGIYSPFELGWTMKNLRDSYEKNYLKDEDKQSPIYVPDIDMRVVLEAIRIRLLPCELLSMEYDTNIVRESAPINISEMSVMEREIDIILKMDRSQRTTFADQLIAARNFDRYGKSHDVHGFAIDPETLEYYITSPHENHCAAQPKLADRLVYIEALQRGIQPSEFPVGYGSHLRHRIAWGFICPGVGDFTVPILQLKEIWYAKTKIAKRILNMRKFIPVTLDGELVED